ncbi:hypothetical protein G7084_05420 [Weissella coleopterorum]|uniref:Uncharacterized protein n=1 Tax=Weissella coleopterorum TaxID=2714949 RepID=A0A6G8B0P5_9LACO|nr:CDP-glycerol glycerophosphotransferase family protein [Weissella coleopterorum]QIL50800.1 hypothetical protein G7084_05420 [Weissella coleopterorum]
MLDKNYDIINIDKIEYKDGTLNVKSHMNDVFFDKLILEKKINSAETSIVFKQFNETIELNLNLSDLSDLRGGYRIFAVRNNRKYAFKYDIFTNKNIWEKKEKLDVRSANPFSFYLGTDQNNLLEILIDVSANVDSELLEIPYSGAVDSISDDVECIHISATFTLGFLFSSNKNIEINPSLFLVRSAEQSQIKSVNYSVLFDENNQVYKIDAFFLKKDFGLMGQWAFGVVIEGSGYNYKLKIKCTSKEVYNNIFAIGKKNWFNSTIPGTIIDPQYLSNGSFILRARPKTKLEDSDVLDNMKLAYQIYKIENKLVLPNKKSANSSRLVFERETWFAQDNAFAIFKSAKNSNKDNNEFKYVINPESPHYERVKNLYSEDVIDLYSVEYFYALLTAKELITSIFPLELLSLYKTSGFFVNKIREIPTYYLGHGVLALKRMTSDYSYKSGLYDRVSVGSNFDYNIHRESLGFPRDRVRKLGYPRWDELNNSTKIKYNQILYFPTWRPWVDKLSDIEFVNSEYFNKIRELLQNDELLNKLKKHKTKLIVYLHPNIRRFSHLLYKTNRSEFVEIIDDSSITVERLEIESDLIISDYSSVVWDFAIQNKPIIFYQFDLKKYELMQGSYFDLKNLPYGKSANDAVDLSNMLDYYLNKNEIYLRESDRNINSFYNFKSMSEKIVMDIMSERVPKKYIKKDMTFNNLKIIWGSE